MRTAAGYSASAGSAYSGSSRLGEGGDLDVVLTLLDLHRAAHAGVLDVLDEAAADVQGGRQRVRVADHLHGVRRGQLRAVDDDPVLAVPEGGLGDDPHRVVDLDRLRAGVPQLLDAVEHVVDADVAARVLDPDDDPGAHGRKGAGEDAEHLGAFAGLRQGRLPASVSLRSERAGLLQLGDLVLGALRGARQRVQHLDEVLLAHALVVVVALVGLHLDHAGEADDRQEHRDDELAAVAGPAHRGDQPVAGGGFVAHHGLTRGTGGAGWRPRWRRSGCRAPRSRLWRADRRRRACPRGRRSARRSARC